MQSGGSQHRGPVEAMALGTREVGLPVLDIGASRVPSTPQGPGHPFLRGPPELPQLSNSHPTHVQNASSRSGACAVPPASRLRR